MKNVEYRMLNGKPVRFMPPMALVNRAEWGDPQSAAWARKEIDALYNKFAELPLATEIDVAQRRVNLASAEVERLEREFPAGKGGRTVKRQARQLLRSAKDRLNSLRAA